MKTIKNFSEIKALYTPAELPAGGYVCKIIGADEKTFHGINGDFSMLEITFDIAEGEYKDFYAENAKMNYGKWKGTCRIGLPDDYESETVNMKKRLLKTFIRSIEESNSGYQWDWDENSFENKLIGIVFRLEQWSVNGRTGWRTVPYLFMPADYIRCGNYSIPKKKPLSDDSFQAAALMSSHD